MSTPRAPSRPIPRRTDTDDIPDEPPPAYEPTPSAYNEQTLEYGPLRPFQTGPSLSTFVAPSGPPLPPPRHPHSFGEPLPQRRPSRSQHRYQPPNRPPPEPDRPYGGITSIATSSSSSSSSPLPPPTFPFWNGSSLTPAQTGFQEGPALAPFGTTINRPAPTSPPQRSMGYEPTSSATPGQPLLNDQRLLVYPVGKELCPKCQNTGYKPFEPGSGYQGDDPSHPCRKCWQKFGKPYTSILRHSHSPSAPPNYQRPLRLFSTPTEGNRQLPPPRPPVIFTNQRPHVNVMGNSLVVRPGDPRIGGVLCRTCGGDGLMMGPFIFDEVTCNRCFGTGRVF